MLLIFFYGWHEKQDLRSLCAHAIVHGVRLSVGISVETPLPLQDNLFGNLAALKRPVTFVRATGVDV